MKNKTLIFAVAILMLVATSCDKRTSPAIDTVPTGDTNTLAPASDNVRELATNAWQKVKEKTTNVMAQLKDGTTNGWASIKESMLAAKDYTYDNKDAFIANAKSDLDALDEKIKVLSDKIASGSESMKADAQAKIQELRDRRAVSGQKLDDVKNSSDTNWEEVKAGFKKSYDDLKSSLKDSWQWLADKFNN